MYIRRLIVIFSNWQERGGESSVKHIFYYIIKWVFRWESYIYVWGTDHPYSLLLCCSGDLIEHVDISISSASAPFSSLFFLSFLPDEKTGPTPEAKTLCEHSFKSFSSLSFMKAVHSSGNHEEVHTIVCYIIAYYTTTVCVCKEYKRQTTKKTKKKKKKLFFSCLLLYRSSAERRRRFYKSLVMMVVGQGVSKHLKQHTA